MLLGGEAKSYDGPWQLKEGIRQKSAIARYSHTRGASAISVLAMGYHNRWNSSDQIPERAVRAGIISRFGQIDTTNGGASNRFSLSAGYRHVATNSIQEIQVFGLHSNLSLYSNFAYLLDDQGRGDQFQQTDRRNVLGLSAGHTQFVQMEDVSHSVKFGLQSRSDFIHGLGLYRTEQRERFATIREDRVVQHSAGLFAEVESRWTERLRSVVGARADGYLFNVTSEHAQNSGKNRAVIVSPKASLAAAFSPKAEAYLSGGFGFHSNDARGTTISVNPVTGEATSRVRPLVRSQGAEIGLRSAPIDQLRSTISAWALNLDSELLFVGDGGTTEPQAASARRGITISSYYRPANMLAIDGDVSWARASFRGMPRGEARIPGAMEQVLTGGMSWNPSAPGAFGALRVRYFGGYPLIENNTVRAPASTMVNADFGYRVSRGAVLQLSLLNAFNTRASDIQYLYRSRLSGESEDGVLDVHFHPVEPRQARLSLDWRF